MDIFRLTPYPHYLADPSWECSWYKQLVWVGAGTPDEARDLVAKKTLAAKPTHPHEPKKISPWYNDRLVGCVPDDPHFEVLLGEVRKIDGQLL